MGIDATTIRVQTRRCLVISIRTCYRSVCKHPFLVGVLCFLTFLYRSFPFLFSLLVSVSPVLVCTAVLLGALLSFGESNIPEIEKDKEEEEDVRHDIFSLKSRSVEDATVVVERDKGFSLETFEGDRGDAPEKAIEEERLVGKEPGEIEVGDGLGEYMPLADKSSWEFQFEKQVVEEVEPVFDDLKLEKKREIREEEHRLGEALSHREVVENHYSLLQDVDNGNLEAEDDKSPRESTGAQKGHHLNYSQDLSMKQAGSDSEEEEEEDEEEDSDSESDRAESSSPDALMADIMPMLDELDPLLDEETPQTAQVSRSGSYAGSERSHKSKESSIDSEDDMEKQADGDGHNDIDEDEDARGGKEDESKSAIKWTEDDQKNLMDLGSLELERNQRLENLIARRRARRNMKLMAEKNLIDLDGADLPMNVPPISTARRNPFDFPYDDDVPGSAPSVLLPRRNPFDLPYDSNEEKPDLKGDSFQQEFSVMQPKELVFRRHESFSVGPSAWGGPRQERQDFRWKPYFLPERFVTDGTSYHTFQRQLSEASESKLSSVPDTESVSSAMEDEDKQLNEEDASQDTEMNSSLDQASVLVRRGSLSSEDADQVAIEQVENGKCEITLGGVDREVDSSLSQSGEAATVELNTSEIFTRMEADDNKYSCRSSMSSVSEIDEKIPDVRTGSTSDVGTGSVILQPRGGQIEESLISTKTSLDSDFNFMNEEADYKRQMELVLDPQGKPIAAPVISTQTSLESDFLSTRAVDDNQHKESVSEQKDDDVEDSDITMHDSESGMHVMSGVGDNDQNKVPELEQRDSRIGESGSAIPMPISQFARETVDGHHHKDPVYDSSPPSVEKYLSFSSMSSDTLAEISEMGSPPAAAEFPGEETVVPSTSMEKDTYGYKAMDEGSSQVQSLPDNEYGEVTEISKHVVLKRELSGIQSYFDCENEFVQLETEADHVSVDSPPLSSEHRFVKEDEEYKEESSHNIPHQLDSSNSDAGTTFGPQQDALETLNSTSSSEEITFHALDGHNPPSDIELPSSEAETLEEPAVQLHSKRDQVHSSTFDPDIQVNGHQSVDENFDSVTSSSVHRPSYNSDLPACKERRPTELAEQVSGEEILHFEQNQVHSSSSDAMIGAALDRGVHCEDVSSGSSYQDVQAEERSSPEKQLSWSDKSMVDPSINSHDEMRESSMSMAESADKVSVANNINVAEDSQDRMSVDITSTASDSNSVPPDPLENKSVVGVDSTISNFDKIVYEDSSDVSAHSNYLDEVYRSSAEVHITEEEGEIKEIDDGLLSELDTVGDFSVKEVAGKSLHIGQIPEASSTVNPELESLPEDSGLTEIKPELPVLEVRSVEDIDLAFKQLHEGADVEEVILPSMIENQLTVDGSKDPEDTDSDLRVVEARSLEDIHVAMKKALEGNTKELPKLSDSKDEPGEVNEVGSTKELPILYVKTHKDVDLAFKQLHEAADVEKVILPNIIEDQLAVDGSKVPEDTDSDLRVVEARSLEDIHVPIKEVSEGNTEELPKLSDDELGEVGSDKELPVLEFKTREDINLAFKQLDEGADVEEVILPSMIEDQLAVDGSKGPDDTDSDLRVVEARSLEDIHVAMKKASEGNTEGLPKLSDSKDELGEVNEVGPNKELPVLEVKTREDMDLAFKELQEGTDVEEVILPSMIVDHLAVDGSKGPEDTDSDLRVVEAKSLEDVHIAMKKASEGNTEELPKHSDSKDEPGEVNEVGSTKELPVLEVKTREDMVLAFKQLQEGTDVEEFILPSMIEDQLAMDGSKGPEDTNSDLRVVEARSLEDIDVAMKKASEGNTKELPKFSDSKDEPGEVDEVSSTKELPVLEVRMPEDIDLAFKQLHEGVDVEGVILPSIIEDHFAVVDSKGSEDNNSDLPVVEARSLEDVNVTLKGVSEGHTMELLNLSDSKDGPGYVEDAGFSMELPVLEVGTHEDIALAFSQLHEGAAVDEVILPSTIEQQLAVDESKDPGKTSSDLQVVEASSLEDIDIAMEQVSKGNIEELPVSMPKDKLKIGTDEDSSKVIESRTLGVNEVGSSKD